MENGDATDHSSEMDGCGETKVGNVDPQVSHANNSADCAGERINSFPLTGDDDEPRLRKVNLTNGHGEPMHKLKSDLTKVPTAGWTVAHHRTLPGWLGDNNYLHNGHRVPTNSFTACFKSIFRIHTETGNIWTHLLGMGSFLWLAVLFLLRPPVYIQWQEQAVFSAFFVGAIMCLGCSWVFHTVKCHSEHICRLFHKLDYCGITFLIIGSFVPWLYYSFYCRPGRNALYLALICFLGIICIVVSMWDKFATPRFRPLRAAVFIALGLSGVIPAMDVVANDGFWHAINYASLGWLLLMAFLYIFGAVIYALRIPEKIFPGKFDIWFQSHQIFHVFVVIAAFVHYHGISEIANYRLTSRDCMASEIQ